jgi:hypothetical protein
MRAGAAGSEEEARAAVGAVKDEMASTAVATIMLRLTRMERTSVEVAAMARSMWSRMARSRSWMPAWWMGQQRGDVAHIRSWRWKAGWRDVVDAKQSRMSDARSRTGVALAARCTRACERS